MTTARFDSTVTTKVGLPIGSFSEAVARLDNLHSLPDGLTFMKEANLLLKFFATECDLGEYQIAKSQVYHEMRARKRL